MNKRSHSAEPMFSVPWLLSCAESFVVRLGNALVTHPKNTELRQHVHHGKVTEQELYERLIELFYRLLFIQLAEAHDLLQAVDIAPQRKQLYRKQHSLRALQEQACAGQEPTSNTRWLALCALIFHFSKGCEELGLPALESELWSDASCSWLSTVSCNNADVDAVLLLFVASSNQPLPWKLCQPQTMGAVYEELMAYQLHFDAHRQQISLVLRSGSKRKATGSYYTPAVLIDCLLEQTLEPAIEQALVGVPKSEQAEALLRLRICDPSCGAGYFLVAAARRLVERLVALHSCDDLAKARQDVLKNCIYGVDINSLSVELCKLVLWFEAADVGAPISRYGQHIQCGNALIDIDTERNPWRQGIPSEAFAWAPGSNKEEAKRLRRINRQEQRRMSQTKSMQDAVERPQEQLVALWCAAFFWPMQQPTAAPTTAVVEGLLQGKKIAEDLGQQIEKLAAIHQFFHWPQAFPQVFADGGFDVVLGNPPYLDSEYLVKHQPRLRHFLTHNYRTAQGNWDLYIPFVELGVRLLRSGGYHAFVTPNKILGSGYATALQQQVFFREQLMSVHDFSQQSLFTGAQVPVVIVVTKKQPVDVDYPVRFVRYVEASAPNVEVLSCVRELKHLPHGYISFPLTAQEPQHLKWLGDRRVKDIAQCSDGASTSEAYALRELVCEGQLSDREQDHTIKLINTGTVDPFVDLWGRKKIKYLGFSGAFPILDGKRLQQQFPRRYEQAMETKIVLAGMSSRLEAVVAPPAFLCGKSAVLVRPHADVCPYALCALFNSVCFRHLYIGLFAMRGISGKAFNIGPRQIELLPIPAADVLQPATLEQVDRYTSEPQNIPLAQQLSVLGQLLQKQSTPSLQQRLEQVVRSLFLQ